MRTITHLILLIALMITQIACTNDVDNSQDADEYMERIINKGNIISEMANRYNANVNWDDFLDAQNDSIAHNAYTFQLESALITSDKRPILFTASIYDITRKEDIYYIQFVNVLDIEPELVFILECNKNLINKIMERPLESFDEYVVVASISTVQKPGYEGKTDNIPETSNIVIARGGCLDIMFTGGIKLTPEISELVDDD